MASAKNFHLTLPPTQECFYTPVQCEYKAMKFWIIVSNIGIMHLSFSVEIHRRALMKIKQFMPEAEFSRLNGKTAPIKNLVHQILDSGHKPSVVDFATNPFLQHATPFHQKIWRLISRIKQGETTTYGQLAAAAGSPRGARAAGHACNQNPLALIIPCHRVVAANGPGGFAGDLAIKLQLLEIEKQLEGRQNVNQSDIECSAFNL